MRLHSAANKFNDVIAVDAYGTDTFVCQWAPHDLFKVEGTRVRVRSMTTAPDVKMPARGVAIFDTEHYLIGVGTPDFWKGRVIRRNYVIQGADGLAQLTSIAGALSGAAPVEAYAATVFAKYIPETGDSSKYPPQYQVFLAGSEEAPADSLVTLNTATYLVKESYLSTSGLRIALANVLSAPLFETVSFGAQTYDPVTDTYSGAATSVKIMRVKWTEHYSYLSIGSETYERGDQQVFMPKTVTPKPSDTLTLSDGKWRVLAVQDETDRWSCHVRRA